MKINSQPNTERAIKQSTGQKLIAELYQNENWKHFHAVEFGGKNLPFVSVSVCMEIDCCYVSENRTKEKKIPEMKILWSFA